MKGVMMPTLQVRDLEQDLYDRLAAVAKQERRSIAQQTIVFIERGLDGHTRKKPQCMIDEEERIAKRQEFFKKLSEKSPIIFDDDFPSDAELVREDRDSR